MKVIRSIHCGTRSRKLTPFFFKLKCACMYYMKTRKAGKLAEFSIYVESAVQA